MEAVYAAPEPAALHTVLWSRPHPGGDSQDTSLPLCGGDVVTLTHAELDMSLVCLPGAPTNAPTRDSVSAPIGAVCFLEDETRDRHAGVRCDGASLWAIEAVGAHRGGEPLRVGAQCRVRHVLSGRHLAVPEGEAAEEGLVLGDDYEAPSAIWRLEVS